MSPIPKNANASIPTMGKGWTMVAPPSGKIIRDQGPGVHTYPLRPVGMEPQVAHVMIPSNPIMMCWSGSMAHGTYMSPAGPNGIDDKDFMVVYIGDLDSYFGPTDWLPKGRHIIIGEWDCTAYEIRKFVKLLLKGNPNVLGSLYLPDDRYIYCTPAWDLLKGIRGKFLTKNIIGSFGGYAKAMFKEMTSTTIPPSGEGPFMGGKRAELRIKHGYDVKAASHALRILQMGIEGLSSGELFPDRSVKGDDEIYRAIKNGEWPLDSVLELGKTLSQEFDSAARGTILPNVPDLDPITETLVKIICKEVASQVVSIAFDGVQDEE